MNEPPASPRVTPGSRRDIGVINYTLARVFGLATGSGPPNIFTTLGRHRGLFRRWLIFASGLMPRGKLPRVDSELLILRTGHNCTCEYELHQHRRLGAQAGLSAEQIARTEGPLRPDDWTPRQATLLRAADELDAERIISQPTWDALREHLSEQQCIELCLLVGHYEMLAMTLNSLGTPLDHFHGGRPSRLGRALQAIANR